MTETTKTQKHPIKAYPYPPDFKSMADVKAYLVKLYVALSENRVQGFAGEVFLSPDPPESYIGKDGSFWIENKG